MKYTKENLQNKCILVTSEKQGIKCVEFFKKHGFPSLLAKRPGKGDYVSLAIWPSVIVITNSLPKEKEVIKLPSEPRLKFPRKMQVSWDNVHWIEVTIIGKVIGEYPYVQQGTLSRLMGWKYAKEIQNDKLTSMSKK